MVLGKLRKKKKRTIFTFFSGGALGNEDTQVVSHSLQPYHLGLGNLNSNPAPSELHLQLIVNSAFIGSALLQA